MNAARPGYRQVAATLREQILSGQLQPGDALPGQTQLARELGADVAVVNRAVGLLEQEGLVAVEHGRRTVVRARHLYSTTVTVPGVGKRSGGQEQMSAALVVAAGVQPSVSASALTVTAEHVVFSLLIEAPDEARAGMAAYELAAAVCGDGWDLASASGSQEPVGESS